MVLGVSAALAACGSSSDDGTSETTGGGAVAVTGQFAAVADAPAGYARVDGEAELQRTNGGTTIAIAVNGLKPKAAYVAHLHTGGCDQVDPGGPHFQFEAGGSDQPPNEIHLRFTSDAAGDGEAEASSKREVPPGEAGSVVIHAEDGGSRMVALTHEGHSHSDKVACAELEGAAAAAAEAPAGGEVSTIVVRDGEPVGGAQELEFSAGEEIRFRVSSDQAEEIHVHGYDVSQDVPAGGTVEFDFPADLEGIYEVELEALGVQILELRINP
jgi:hypothetical protein